MENLDSYVGTRFTFKEIKTGKEVQIFSPNKITWIVPDHSQIEEQDPDTGETRLIWVDATFPFERFIQLYAPTEAKGAAFLKHVLMGHIRAHEDMVQVFTRYLQEHCDEF